MNKTPKHTAENFTEKPAEKSAEKSAERSAERSNEKFAKFSKLISGFKLSNLFNLSAAIPCALVFLGVLAGAEFAWMATNAEMVGLRGNIAGPMNEGLKWMSNVLGGGLALYNAKAISGQTVLFNNVAANGARNLMFMGASALGGTVAGAGIAMAMGYSVTLQISVVPIIAGAALNAVSLRWKPYQSDKRKTPNKLNTPNTPNTPS